jgi:hypothetical protein
MRSTGITAQQINEITGTFMGSHYTTDKSQPSVATADLFDKLRPYLPAVPAEIEELVRSRTIEIENMKRRAVLAEETRYNEPNGIVSLGRARTLIDRKVTAPYSEDAQRWAGWGTALKPAHEPIVVARKPLIGTVAANVLRHGTGALNIDGCRISAGPGEKLGGGAEKATTAEQKGNTGWIRPWMDDDAARAAHAARVRVNVERAEALGRWPANVIHDGSEEVLAGFPVTTSRRSDTPQPVKTSKGVKGGAFGNDAARKPEGHDTHPAYVRGGFDDTGSAARFYYCAKASKAEREAGLVALAGKRANVHPTVKPVALMKYLLRLVLPPGGIALDPFAGSGTTLVAAAELGMTAIGIERDPAYVEIAAARVQAAEARAARGDADTDADTDEEGEE